MNFYISTLFQFIRFSRGLQDWGQENPSDFGPSVWAFCGNKPHKNCSHCFFKFWKKYYVQKKSKNIFPILGQKTMQIDVIWSQGYVKIVFLTKNQFYNFLIFGLRKISKIFEKFVKFFSNFFSNFSIFYTFFANFYKFHQLLTHLELYRTLQNMSSVIGWGDKRFQISTKIQLFRTNFLE